MKLLTTATLAALLIGSVGIANLVPAYADNAASPAPAMGTPASPPAGPDVAATDPHAGRPGMWRHMGRGQSGGPGGMRDRLLDIACGDRGAEALEILLVHVQYGVKPTATQQPLFDALKTAALADQKTFATACTSARTTPADGNASIVDRLQQQLTIETAKVTALNDVLPKFKAFYDSLDATQKTALEPRQWGGPRFGSDGRGMRPGMMGGHMGRMHHQAPQPDDATPPAGSPAAAPSPADSSESPA